MVSDQIPSSEALSRRTVLASSAVIGAVGLAGCSADASSESADCTTTALEHGDGDILQQASAMISDESVVLLISLQESGDALPIESILLENSEGDLLDEIPTTEAREYRITIGSPPHHGHLRLLAENDQSDEIDSLEIEYHCTE
ncbi:hypothetical protein [Natrinema longum]|uniref:hypothetical protein n=1 Tax=Natrinema longum TaxID=370324 RepID=UPI001CCAE3AE|nr:hypothetical protein [Natrinema longum]MBZ6497039.1 hypothetical protein [Natrinema longum]